MVIDIFIRTYSKDFQILKYCLKSIKKFASGYRNIILCVREKEYDQLLQQLNVEISDCTIIKAVNFSDEIDYCGQQISKLNAHNHTNAEYICFVDSDCIFYNYVNLEEAFFDENKKLILLKDYWNDVGDALCWKPCLSKLELLTEYEFMRRIPQVYPTSIFSPIKKIIESKMGTSWHVGCLQIYNEYKLSEFNIMGSYMYMYDKENTNFLFSNDNKIIIPTKQFWSYSFHNDTENRFSEIEALLA